MASRVRAIDAYARSGLSSDWHTERVRSLWVTPDEAHARRLVTWVGRERPWVHAWFAALPALSPSGFDGPAWWIVNGGERRFRLIAPEGLPV